MKQQYCKPTPINAHFINIMISVVEGTLYADKETRYLDSNFQSDGGLFHLIRIHPVGAAISILLLNVLAHATSHGTLLWSD